MSAARELLEYTAGYSPVFKLVSLVLLNAAKDRARHLAFVLRQEADSRHMYLLQDNRFRVPPPAHLFSDLSCALDVLAQSAVARGLVGRFVHEGRTPPPEVGKYTYGDLERWDVYFAVEEARNLLAEVRALLEGSSAEVEQALAQRKR